MKPDHTNFSFIIVHSRYHVLCDPGSRENTTLEPANYRQTGKALHAILSKEDTPAAFLERFDNKPKKKDTHQILTFSPKTVGSFKISKELADVIKAEQSTMRHPSDKLKGGKS